MQDLLRKLQNGLNKMLYGRYGVDQFTSALVIMSIVFSLLFTFTHWAIFYILSTALWIYPIYRIFSKNFAKRQKENMLWLKYSAKGKKSSHLLVRRVKDFPKYKYYKCMNCKQTIRIPRGKGRVEIRCPKCGYSFRSKT